MGERVTVGRVMPAEPVDPPGGAGAGGAGEPLNYGRGNRGGDAWRWSRAWGAAVLESVSRVARPFAATLGGWRRIFFALGLACLLGGFGDCLRNFSGGDGVFWMFLGGLLIGLTVRVPLRGSES